MWECIQLLVWCLVTIGMLAQGTLATGLVCAPQNSNSSCSDTTRSVLGLCTSTTVAGCCDGASAGTFGAVCSSVVYDSNENRASTHSCSGDGQQLRCSGGGHVRSLCVGPQCSGGSGCNSAIHVAQIECATVPSLVNTSDCTWRYGDSVGLSGCAEGLEALTGICVSPVNKFCGGSTVGINCCSLTKRLSRTATLSPSVSITKTTTRTVSPSRTLPMTSTPTHPITPTPSSPNTLTHNPTATWYKSRTHSSTRTLSMAPTATKTGPVTQSPTLAPSASFTHSASPSSTLPSLTIPPSVSVSVTPPPKHLVTALSTLDVDDIHVGNTTLILEVSNLEWDRSAVPFLPLYMVGSQDTSPFGFNARQEALLEAAVVITPNQLMLSIREDHCFEPRGTEEVHLQLPSTMFTPRISLDAEPSFLIEGIDLQAREVAGLLLIASTACLLVAAIVQGYAGPVLITILSIQNGVLIATHACSRSRIAAYATEAKWFVVPSFTATAFESDPHFGSALVHLLLVFFTLLIHLLMCRKSLKARKLFPSVPFFVGAFLMQGLCNSAWQSLLQGEVAALRAFSFIISLLYLVPLFGYAILRYEPGGLSFVRYPAGQPRMYLSGTFYPDFLRVKFCSLCDMWHRNALFMTPVTLIFYAVSSFLNAFFVSTPNRCFGVMGVLLAIHTMHFLYMLYMRPGRSIVLNCVLLVPLVVKLIFIIGVLVSLDCMAIFPLNVRFGEAMTVISIILWVASAVVLLGLATVEKKFRTQAAKEQLQHSRDENASRYTTGSPISPPLPDGILQYSFTGKHIPAGDGEGSVGGGANPSFRSQKSASLSPSQGEGVAAGSPRPNPLPPLTHFEIRDSVTEDPTASQRRGRLESRHNVARSTYLRIEDEVPEHYDLSSFTFGANNNGAESREGSIQAGSLRGGSPSHGRQQHSDVPTLNLNLEGTLGRARPSEGDRPAGAFSGSPPVMSSAASEHGSVRNRKNLL